MTDPMIEKLEALAKEWDRRMNDGKTYIGTHQEELRALISAEREGGKPWDDPCPECGFPANRHDVGCWRGLKTPSAAAGTEFRAGYNQGYIDTVRSAGTEGPGLRDALNRLIAIAQVVASGVELSEPGYREIGGAIEMGKDALTHA